MGITIRELVYDIGGGPREGEIKAVQIGGPSGGCIPEPLFDTPVDFDSLQEIGAMMGSGGVIVLDDSACMVNVARFFLEFTVEESCGKCTPCRVGSRTMLAILDRIVNGQGTEEDLERLTELAELVKSASLCGLGQTAPGPVLSTLRYFRDEHLAHIRDRACPAGVCPSLIHYRIDPEACRACDLCRRACPTGAIEGAPGKPPYLIQQELCIRCGACQAACPFGAVQVRPGRKE